MSIKNHFLGSSQTSVIPIQTYTFVGSINQTEAVTTRILNVVEMNEVRNEWMNEVENPNENFNEVENL